MHSIKDSFIKPISSLLALYFVSVHGLIAEDNGSASAPGKLGVLLDVSASMGFVVPQVRKEVRLTNQHLRELGREEIAYREMLGSSLDKAESFAVPASRNAYHAMRKLFEDESVSTIYWINSLKGQHSVPGFALVEELLSQTPEAQPARQLIIRNVWQEQLANGEDWVIAPPDLESDPLDLRNRPGEWYRLLENDRGFIRRSWQTPPPTQREQFAFPFRIRSHYICRKLNIESNEAYFDITWANDLKKKHHLSWSTEKETWLRTFTGRRWLYESTLIPFPGDDFVSTRNEKVFSAMSSRPTIAEDLAAIEAGKIGAVFGFAYIKSDLDRHQRYGDERYVSWSVEYMKDLMSLVRETRAHQKESSEPSHVFRNELIELPHRNRLPRGVDPVVGRIGELIAHEKVDAIYLFTNGYMGKSEYGDFTLDFDLLSRGIRERNVPLFVRIPFEFGVAPREFITLAKESGGRVFHGNESDPDWKFIPVKK